jgi:hypothetical protein
MFWIFPYLPLAERMTVGPWILIPSTAVSEEDTGSAAVTEQALGLGALYRMPADRRGYGAFVRSVDGHVGEDVDEVALGRLSQAVTVALLDRNPSPVNPPADDWRAAHATATVENARLIGHGIDDDGYTAFEYGVMVRMLVGGYRVGEDADVIAPPQELELPLNRPRIDDVYAAALYDVLSNLAEDSPDLPGATRFLEVAWANSRSVRPEARILVLRAGFDVLFGGAQTNAIRSALSGLLDPDGTPRTRREWTDHHGRAQQADLTDLEWWFTSFAALRNKIAHGGAIAAEEYEFEGVHHVFHAELHLRGAIKKIVAEAGHEDVLLGPYERIARRYEGRALEELLGDDEPGVRRLL